MAKAWSKCKHKGKYALLRIIIFKYFWKLIVIFLMFLTVSILQLFEPLILKEIILYIESQEVSNEAKLTALMYTLLLLLNLFFYKILDENLRLYKLKVKTQVNQAVTAIIYSKLLKVSSSTNKLFDRGWLINMSQNDTMKIVEIFETLPKLMIFPFIVCFILLSLYFLIGFLIIYAIAMVMMLGILNYLIAKWQASIQKYRLKTLDRRIEKVTETI